MTTGGVEGEVALALRAYTAFCVWHYMYGKYTSEGQPDALRPHVRGRLGRGGHQRSVCHVLHLSVSLSLCLSLAVRLSVSLSLSVCRSRDGLFHTATLPLAPDRASAGDSPMSVVHGF